MATDADPIIDEWYHYPEKGQKCRVTDLDECSASIEIQYLDGGIDHIDMDAWKDLNMMHIDPPEDGTG